MEFSNKQEADSSIRINTNKKINKCTDRGIPWLVPWCAQEIFSHFSILLHKILFVDMDFESSKLGTKTYWDDVYKRELDNFEQHGDTGEVWFGLRAAESIVEW